MAFVWLCATPCGATGPAPDTALDTATGPATATGSAAEVVTARADAPVDVRLSVLRRGAVALVLATAVVAGLSAGDARAIVSTAAPDLAVAASAPAPDLPAVSAPASVLPVAASVPAPAGGERLFPRRRGRA